MSVDTNSKNDEGKIGVVLVDILYALVLGKVLEFINWSAFWRAWHSLGEFKLSSYSSLSYVKSYNLILGILITLMSWIGYHNSSNRSSTKIKFFNRQFFLFLIDVILVFIYWLLVTSTRSNVSTHDYGVIAAGLIFATYFLYLIWDLVTLSLREKNKTISEILWGFLEIIKYQIGLLVSWICLSSVHLSILNYIILISLILIGSIWYLVTLSLREKNKTISGMLGVSFYFSRNKLSELYQPNEYLRELITFQYMIYSFLSFLFLAHNDISIALTYPLLVCWVIIFRIDKQFSI